MRLIEDESIKSELPWVNEYVNSSTGEAGDVSPITDIKKTTKGLLVLCKDFKGFIFAGQQTYNHLVAAFDVWKSSPNLNFRLYGQATSSGKLAIAIEDKEQSVFLVNKPGDYSFKFSEEGNGSQGVDSTNPFLQGSPVPTTSGKAKVSK